ncbi:MAG: helix-turn-helix domain-containing protein [Deltaproteobacteria bacterium]|nr:helix-turn-helix domain-containing protein [Deltaproteobacteria bacterium]
MQQVLCAQMTCSTCLAFEPKTAGDGLCLLFGRPPSRKRDPRWPRTYPEVVACESFKPGDGPRPKPVTLADYPKSSIITCQPGSEPTKNITVSRGFLLMSIRSALNGPLDKEQFLSVAKVAYRLGISNDQVRDYINSGQLPAKKKREGWMIKEYDFKTFSETWRPGRPGKQPETVEI